MKRTWLVPLLLLSASSLAILNVPSIPSLKELNCLATNVYYEARGEPLLGQIEVAKVVLARVNDRRWPDSICEVVYQPNQFSWTNSHTKVKYNLESLKAAVLAYNSTDIKHTYYHNKKVSPKWKRNLKHGVTIGNHIFYYEDKTK